MSISTFDGPVRSLGGMYSQGPNGIVTLGATATLTVADHAGKMLLVPATCAITLPTIVATAYPSSSGPGGDPNSTNNLNVSFNYVEGESLIMGVKDLAVSSGSACTSASLEPSYVLRALGRSDELAHSSLRMTIGRFTTEAEVDFAVKLLHEKVAKLRELSPLWDMYKDGIDLSTIQWAAH